MPSPPSGDLSRDQPIRLIAGRVGLVTLLLGTLTYLDLAHPDILPYPRSISLYWILVATYLLTLVYLAVASRGVRTDLFMRGQVAIDVLLATLVVVYSGGIDSPFTFLYPVIILAAAEVLPHRHTFAVAAFCSLSYGGTVLLQYFYHPGLVFPYPPPASLTDIFVYYSLFLAFLTFFLVAFLGDYLTTSLRRTGRELLRHQMNLADLQAQTSHIFQSLQSGLFTTDLGGTITTINPAGEQILGVPAGSLIGISVNDLFPAPGERAILAGVGDNPERTEFRHHRDSRGDAILLGLTVSLLRNDRGEHTGYLAIFQDLTPMRAMEEEIRRTQKLAAIGEMAAGLAHELKNPLAPITGSVEMLRDRVKAVDRPLIDLIIRETERLDHLVNNFLQYARPRPPQPRPTDLDRFIADIIELLRREKRVAAGIEIRHRPGIPGPIAIDPRMIHQVLWNLILNAVEAITPPGHIEITTVASGSRVAVTIADDGEGIPADRLGQVFTPFFTSKEDGTGLGLPICERIIDLHGGTISIASTPGKGTGVTFTLPAGGVASNHAKEDARAGTVHPGR